MSNARSTRFADRLDGSNRPATQFADFFQPLRDPIGDASAILSRQNSGSSSGGSWGVSNTDAHCA